MNGLPPHRASSTLGNKLWRLQNLYAIRNKQKQITKLRLNAIQRRIFAHIQPFLAQGTPIRHFDLKYRQGGVSTFWLLWLLDDVIAYRNTITGIIAHKWDSLKYIFEIIKLAYEFMPLEFKPEAGKDSVRELDFPALKSKIFVSLDIESTAVHNLHISEYARCNEDKVRRTVAACPPNAHITYETVGNGFNHGRDKFKEMQSLGQAQFHPWFIQEEYRLPLNGVTVIRTEQEQQFAHKALKDYGIHVDDEQILYRRWAQKEYKNLFDQEMAEDPDSCFLTSGDSFFDNRKINKLILEAETFKPVTTTPDYTQWFLPERGHLYAAGADTAEGVDGDYSVLAIMDVTDRKQVFRYRARVGVDAFYRICNRFCRQYNNAKLAVERNNHGHAVILGLRESCHYPNLYSPERHRIVYSKPRTVNGNGQHERKYGWDTNSNTRSIILDGIKQAIEGQFEDDEDHFDPEFLVLDNIFLQECLSFMQIHGKLQAAVGKHDDCIFAWAIAYQVYAKLKGFNAEKSILIGGKREAI